MTQSDYQSFADNYTSDDIDRIKFDWNGEHGDNFENHVCLEPGFPRLPGLPRCIFI